MANYIDLEVGTRVRVREGYDKDSGDSVDIDGEEGTVVDMDGFFIDVMLDNVPEPSPLDGDEWPLFPEELDVI